MTCGVIFRAVENLDGDELPMQFTSQEGSDLINQLLVFHYGTKGAFEFHILGLKTNTAYISIPKGCAHNRLNCASSRAGLSLFDMVP